MGNIIYKVVSREIAKERLNRDSSGRIFREEKVMETILKFAQFFNIDYIYDVYHVKILLYL